jgi:exodeoxyribonuclease VII small subunit
MVNSTLGTEMNVTPEVALEALSFEETLLELDRIVDRLEREKLSLDQSLALFERGQALGERCARLLDEAELKIKQLMPAADGDYREVPFCGDEQE